MTIRPATIWEAARNRLPEWTPWVRFQDGLRSLPGSPRFTDKDIWSAPSVLGATDKSQCGSAKETARQSREDVSSIIVVRQFANACCKPSPTPTSLAYVSLRGSPYGGIGKKASTRNKSMKGGPEHRTERTKPSTH